MAIGIKYRANYKDVKNTSWRVDIGIEGYSGSIINVRTAEGEACIISYDTDDSLETGIIPSKADISLVNTGNIDVKELQSLGEDDAIVSVYKGSALEWRGFLVADGIQEDYSSVPNVVNVTAVDGLARLDGRSYDNDKSADYIPMPPDVPADTFLGHFSRILMGDTNLGLPLPIRWVCNIRSRGTNVDFISYTSRWGTREDAWRDEVGNARDCYWVLNGLVKSLGYGSRIYQAGGRWNIERGLDVVTGVKAYKQRNVDSSAITSGTVTQLSKIGAGGSIVIDDVQTVMQAPALKRAVITYGASRFDNILPNGSQDYVETLDGEIIPIDWGLRFTDDNKVHLASKPTLDRRSGYSTEVNATGYNDPSDSIPTLLEALNARFTTVVEGTAPNPDGGWYPSGTIAWLPLDTNNLFSTIRLGFKYLVTAARTEKEIVDGIELQPIRSIRRGAGNINEPESTFPVRFSVALKVKKNYNNNHIIYYLNEFGYWKPSVTNDANGIPIVREMLSANPDNLPVEINDVVTVDFNKGGDIKLPEFPFGEIEQGDLCSIAIEFYVFGKTAVRFDDIYITTDAATDVFESVLEDSRATQSHEETIDISSSFSGVFSSNVMRDWYGSNHSYVYEDNKYMGSLTDMYANSVMRMRATPKSIVDISFDVSSFTFGTVFELEGYTGKFALLNTQYNTENSAVGVTLHEVLDGDYDLESIQYSAKDYIGSGGWITNTGGGGGGTLQDLQSVTDMGAVTTNTITARGVKALQLLEIPNNEPPEIDVVEGRVYIWGDKAGNSSQPSPIISNLEDLQNVADTIPVGQYLYKDTDGIWKGKDIPVPDLSGYAKESWVTSQLGSYVPTSRTVNGKPLTGNISLTASDVGAITQAAADVRYVTIATKQVVTGAKRFSKALGLPDSVPVSADMDAGAVYIWSDGTGGGSTPSPTSLYLEDLLDVTITNPVNKQVLQWNGTRWVNGTVDIPDLTGYAKESWVQAGYYSRSQSDDRFALKGEGIQVLSYGTSTRPYRISLSSGGGFVEPTHLDASSTPSDEIETLQTYFVPWRNVFASPSTGIRLVRQSTADASFSFDLGMIFNSGKLSYRAFNGTAWSEISRIASEDWARVNFVELGNVDQSINGTKTFLRELRTPEGVMSSYFKTNADSTDFSQIIRNGVGSALYVNQISTAFHIMSLSSGTSGAGSGVKFLFGGLGDMTAVRSVEAPIIKPTRTLSLPRSVPPSGDMDAGAVYIWSDGTGGGSTPSPSPNYLRDLLDVTITSPAVDQVLRWNGTRWVNSNEHVPSLAGYAKESWVESGYYNRTQSDNRYTLKDADLQVFSYTNATHPYRLSLSKGGGSVDIGYLALGENLPPMPFVQNYFIPWRNEFTATSVGLRLVRSSTAEVTFGFDLGMSFNSRKLSYREHDAAGWGTTKLLASENWVSDGFLSLTDSRISNWNSAYNWGNHAGRYIANSVSNAVDLSVQSSSLDYDNISGAGIYFMSGSALNNPLDSAGGMLINMYSSVNNSPQMVFGSSGTGYNFIMVRNRQSQAWNTMWHSGNLRSNGQNDSRYLLRTTDTLTGNLTVTNNLYVDGQARFMFQGNTWYKDGSSNDRLYFGTAANANGVILRGSQAGHQLQIRSANNDTVANIDMETGLITKESSGSIGLELIRTGSTINSTMRFITNAGAVVVGTGNGTDFSVHSSGDLRTNAWLKVTSTQVIGLREMTAPIVKATRTLGLPKTAPPSGDMETGVVYIWGNI